MYFWIFWICTSTIFFGILGFIASMISLILYSLFILKILTFDNIKDKGLSKQTQRENLMLDISEILEKEDNKRFDIHKIISYKQILFYGTNREKIELIGMVVYNPSAEFVNLIQISLNDKNETVRILSSTSLQKMESFYEDKITEFEIKIKEADNTKVRSLFLIKLINIYHRYIQSTLIDDSLKNIYINKMFSQFKNINIFKNINTLENDKLFLNTYIKLSVKYGRVEGIEDLLINKVTKNNKNSDKFLLMELYYKELNFPKLYEVLETIDINKLRNIKQKNSYEYWSDHV